MKKKEGPLGEKDWRQYPFTGGFFFGNEVVTCRLTQKGRRWVAGKKKKGVL